MSVGRGQRFLDAPGWWGGGNASLMHRAGGDGGNAPLMHRAGGDGGNAPFSVALRSRCGRETPKLFLRGPLLREHFAPAPDYVAADFLLDRDIEVVGNGVIIRQERRRSEFREASRLVGE